MSKVRLGYESKIYGTIETGSRGKLLFQGDEDLLRRIVAGVVGPQASGEQALQELRRAFNNGYTWCVPAKDEPHYLPGDNMPGAPKG